MLHFLRQMLRPKPASSVPAIPAGERVYAIGDVHGQASLFEALVVAIERDDAERGPADTTIVLLGDLIDRGPDSAGVIAAARKLQQRRRTRIITGNHEEMFLECFTDCELLRHFLRFGGRETILSYPVEPATLHLADVAEVQEIMHRCVPDDDLAFIRGFEDSVIIGDYLFVHAGIRPGQAIERQQPRDLRWIREPFLSHEGSHGFVVVHGHTIADEPQVRDNRIGIDTGAYLSGRLTALGLEGQERWLIETRHREGSIDTVTRAT